MGKRAEQKRRTRQMILKTAKRIFVKNGFLKATTAQISEKTGIAQGTLFLHFPNKESLIVAVLDIELSSISDEIQVLIDRSVEFEDLLSRYLDLLMREENLFSVLAKELPFYSDELRRKILFREANIRNHFQKAINRRLKKSDIDQCNISGLITMLFGTIHYYLSLKTMFVKEGSVIKKFKDTILKNFVRLIQ